jgi:hypothetical protein
MPGPRGKAKAKKSKPKPKAHSLANLNATSEDSEFNELIDDVDGAEGWNKIVNVLCEFLQLPGVYTCNLSLGLRLIAYFP